MIVDIAVIGGGAAGCMAAVRAAELGKSVTLIERNDSIGRKMLLTGKGRCNLTNTASIDAFIERFSPNGEFLRSALYAFSNEDLMDFFRRRGLELKAERQGRVFPADDNARSVVSVLGKALEALKVKVEYDTRITGIEKGDGHFILVSEDSQRLKTRKVVIATGGASYKATGSTGDGFLMAGRLGHKVAALKPALVPLKAKEPWVKDLQGLGLENVRITFHPGGKRIGSDVGEVMFTHFGVSGPLVLDMSGAIVSALERYKEVLMTIDLKPGLRKEQLESKLLHKFSVKGSVQLKNLMQDILPRRMIAVFLSALKLNGDKRASQIKKEERTAIIDALKSFPLTITGSLPVEEAMVTAGGVSLKEVDPRTMESKRVPGLYFAGEALDLAAPSGGYNLQAAFSTGYLAGEKAAK